MLKVRESEREKERQRKRVKRNEEDGWKGRKMRETRNRVYIHMCSECPN